jgi:DNA invertase Pin-like site-specific DNA recombinase
VPAVPQGRTFSGVHNGAPIVWAYCRVSTTKVDQELSLDEQEKWARDHAATNNLQIKVVRERASAKNTIGRPEFQKMMTDLAQLSPSKRPQRVLVTSFDRLSRDMTDTMIISRTLRTLRVELFVRDSGGIVKGETFAERAAIVGQSMGGEAENEARSNRMKASWERRGREGKPKSNKVPYGIQLRGERDVPIPESAEWVRLAFSEYAKGTGMYTIAKRFKDAAPDHRWLTSKLDQLGNRIEKVRRTKWDSNRIRKLLELKRYRGVVVEEDIFDQVQCLMQARPKKLQQRQYEYPLSGAIKCKDCGRSLHGHASGGGTSKRTLANGEERTYVNQIRTRYYDCLICGYALNANRLESSFIKHVRSMVADDSLLQAWTRVVTSMPRSKVDLRREILKLSREIDSNTVQAQEDAVLDLALSSSSSAEVFDRKLSNIRSAVETKRARIAELQKLLDHELSSARLLSDAQHLIKSFDELYHDATYEEKRELVQSIVSALGGAQASKDGIIWLRAKTTIRRQVQK